MLCIIQSRMSSNRLPGKMLMELNGKTLLGRVIDRVKGAKKISKIIVATSTEKEDDDIESFCDRKKILCYRGELTNVYKRYCKLIILENASHFIRVNGDSPLIDPNLIDFFISNHETNYDINTNIFPRTFPKGQSVEIINSKSFLDLEKHHIMTRSQLEHVTKYFYDNSNLFLIKNFKSDKDYSKLNYCIDTIKDFNRLEAITKISGNEITWQELANKFC